MRARNHVMATLGHLQKETDMTPIKMLTLAALLGGVALPSASQAYTDPVGQVLQHIITGPYANQSNYRYSRNDRDHDRWERRGYYNNDDDDDDDNRRRRGHRFQHDNDDDDDDGRRRRRGHDDDD